MNLQNLRILVCRTCLDTPQEQLRSIILPSDPEPIINARPELYQSDESDNITLVGGATIDPTTGIPVPGTTVLDTVAGDAMEGQPIGPSRVTAPPSNQGLDPNAQMALVIAQHFAVLLPVVSISSLGTTVITVTCSAAHGLASDAQVSVEGVSSADAAGTFSITVTTATAFTYQANQVIPSGNILTATTRVITMNVGLPYGFTQVPQTGI